MTTGRTPASFTIYWTLVLVSARNKLQKLKHVDGGIPEEREQLMAVLSAFEGPLMLGLVIGGISAESTDPGETAA